MLRVKSKKQKLNLNLSGIPWRLPELMARLQETEGMSLSGEQALAMAAALGFTEEPYFFRFEELNSETFDTKLAQIQAEARKAEQAAAAEKRRAEAARASQAQSTGPTSTSGTSAPQEVIDDDRSGQTAVMMRNCLGFVFLLHV